MKIFFYLNDIYSKIKNFLLPKKDNKKMRKENYYEELFYSIKVLNKKKVSKCVNKIERNYNRYLYVSNQTGVPAVVVGILHCMEGNCNFKKGLHNGEPWNKETTLVPKGVGPFSSWEKSAVDALLMKKNNFPKDNKWDINSVGNFFERYNGMGYANKNKNSPYLWSMSNHGVGVGKYTSDGNYNENAVSNQCGSMVILSFIGEEYLNNDYKEYNDNLINVINSKDFNEYAVEFQNFANTVFRMRGDQERLVVDGYFGSKTKEAFIKIFNVHF